jgi:hypothetical protein
MAIITNPFSINGVISTDKTILQNINALCEACGCWMTYDIDQGKWSVIINRATASSVTSFNDSNIIGGINVSGTGINELYNTVTVEFPHKDLRDQTDYVDFAIPTLDRFPNEQERTLNMQVDLINDPVQAQFIGTVELKQSRVDKVIQFRTDFSKLGLKAGDVIDITNEPYGYTNKFFRITRIEESDEDGILLLSITALEYDADVYDSSSLERVPRTKNTGIIAKAANTALVNKDNTASLKMEVSDSASLRGLALTYAGATAGKWILDFRSPSVNINATAVQLFWYFEGSGGGEDLDIRCRIIEPNVGQNTLDQCLGFTGTGGGDPQFPTGSVRYWPTSGAPILGWGGDNTGAGNETVLISISQFKIYYPSATRIIVECRGNWFTTPSTTPVRLQATLYNGGTFTLSGYEWANAGATKVRQLNGIDVYVDSYHGGSVEADGYNGETAPGDLMGYFVYDIAGETGQFWNYLPEDVVNAYPL